MYRYRNGYNMFDTQQIGMHKSIIEPDFYWQPKQNYVPGTGGLILVHLKWSCSSHTLSMQVLHGMLHASQSTTTTPDAFYLYVPAAHL